MMAALECCFAGSANGTPGVVLSIPSEFQAPAWLFAETTNRALVSVERDKLQEVLDALEKMGQECSAVGEVGGETLTINQLDNRLVTVRIEHLIQTWQRALEKLLV